MKITNYEQEVNKQTPEGKLVSVYTHSTFQALQMEAKSDVIKKMSLYSHENKTHFHKKGFALSLVLEVRVLPTLKWPI